MDRKAKTVVWSVVGIVVLVSFWLLSVAAQIYDYERPRNFIVAALIIAALLIVPAVILGIAVKYRRAFALLLLEYPKRTGVAIAQFLIAMVFRAGRFILIAVMRLVPFAALTAGYVAAGFGILLLLERLGGSTVYGVRSYSLPQVLVLAVAASLAARGTLSIASTVAARVRQRKANAAGAPSNAGDTGSVRWLVPALRRLINTFLIVGAGFIMLRDLAPWLQVEFTHWVVWFAAASATVAAVIFIVYRLAFRKEEESPHA